MFIKENETLYLTTWEYNAALILAELEKIIINNGGRVKPNTPGFIVNRSLTRLEHETREKIAAVSENIESGKAKNPDIAKNYLKNLESDLAEVKKINNDPVKVDALSYIRFIYGAHMYYIQFDHNPFFEFYYSKTPIDGAGTYSRDACSEELSKDWLWDCFFATIKKPATAEDRREAAELIFNELTTAKCSFIRIDGHKTRVPNTYNSGYHYEFIRDKERRAAVDF